MIYVLIYFPGRIYYDRHITIIILRLYDSLSSKVPGHSIDSEIGVDDRKFVPAHLCCAGHMVHGQCAITYQVVESLPVNLAGRISRLTNGFIAAELPSSRLISIPFRRAARSRESPSIFAWISGASAGSSDFRRR